jgi:predicted AAA+ superfamily ATPase
MIFKKYIPRSKYIQATLPFLHTDLIKVYTGQRRVGKSYMLYQIIDEIKKRDSEANIIYINKELVDFDTIRDYISLNSYFETHKQIGKKNYLFIDEVQEIEQFEKCLRSIQAKGEAEIFITGSNAKLLSSELSTFLSGRYVEIRVFGLSFTEFLLFHDLEKNNESFFKYIKFGGLPGITHLPLEDDIVFDYLKNVYAAILFKDVVKRHNIRSVSFLENLVKFLADNIASLVSANKISDYLKSQKVKVSPNIVLDYISYLESAYFIFKVQRTEITGKKVFEIGEKYYFEDLGLRHSILGYRQNDINKILENIVYIHLRIAGYDVKIGWDQGKEIDFVCEKNGEKRYIQVAYLIPDDKVREREFGNLLNIRDNYPKLVLSMDNFIGTSYKGIEHKSILEFIAEI